MVRRSLRRLPPRRLECDHPLHRRTPLSAEPAQAQVCLLDMFRLSREDWRRRKRLTSVDTAASRASPYATGMRAQAYSGAHHPSQHHHQPRAGSASSSVRPSSAKAALTSAPKAASQGRKAGGREEAPARKPRKRVAGGSGRLSDQYHADSAAAERERRWAQEVGVFVNEDDDDDDGEGDGDGDMARGEQGSPISCISAGDGESDLIYDDDEADDAEADIFDANLLQAPRPPSGVRTGPPSAGFLRPGVGRATAGGDAGLGAVETQHMYQDVHLQHAMAGRAFVDDVERDLLVSPQRVRRSLDRSLDQGVAWLYRDDAGYSDYEASAGAALNHLDLATEAARRRSAYARDALVSRGGLGVYSAATMAHNDRVEYNPSQWGSHFSHTSDGARPRHGGSGSPGAAEEGRDEGARQLGTGGGARIMSRPQTAPATREGMMREGGRVSVLPEQDSPKKKVTTIRLTATGCFRSSNVRACLCPSFVFSHSPPPHRPLPAHSDVRSTCASSPSKACSPPCRSPFVAPLLSLPSCRSPLVAPLLSLPSCRSPPVAPLLSLPSCHSPLNTRVIHLVAQSYMLLVSSLPAPS